MVEGPNKAVYLEAMEKFKTKVTNLQKLGLSQRDAYVFASTRKGYWRTAHSKTLSYSLTNIKTGTTRTYDYVQDAPVNSKWLSCRTAVYGTVRTVVWEVDNWTNQLSPTRFHFQKFVGRDRFCRLNWLIFK